MAPSATADRILLEAGRFSPLVSPPLGRVLLSAAITLSSQPAAAQRPPLFLRAGARRGRPSSPQNMNRPAPLRQAPSKASPHKTTHRPFPPNPTPPTAPPSLPPPPTPAHPST